MAALASDRQKQFRLLHNQWIDFDETCWDASPLPDLFSCQSSSEIAAMTFDGLVLFDFSATAELMMKNETWQDIQNQTGIYEE